MTRPFIEMEDSHNGIATVLKTVGVKPVNVRIVHLPHNGVSDFVQSVQSTAWSAIARRRQRSQLTRILGDVPS